MKPSSSRNEFVLTRIWPQVVAAVMIIYVLVLLALVASDIAATSTLLRSM